MSQGLSVVIPTHRRPDKIAACLDALAASDYPRGRLQVLVVEDGGPTDALAELRARSFDPLELIWLDQPHAGPAVARNLGAQHATRELVAFTDDDCCPRPDWARRLDAQLRSSPGSVVGGHTVNKVVGNRQMKKRFHVRVEHVRHSKCRKDFLDRVKKNEAIKAEYRARGEKPPCLKRVPVMPRKGYVVSNKKTEIEVLAPLTFVEHFV